MSMTKRLLVSFLLSTGTAALLPNMALAGGIFSDTFSGATLDPAWQVLPGAGSYTVGGGKLVYYNSGPMASTTGWNNSALTLALPFSGTSWELDIEATYNLYWNNGSGSSSGAQGPEVLVAFADDPSGTSYAGSDFAVFERNIDAYYSANWLGASYGAVVNDNLLNPADATIHNNVADGTYWLQIIRNGGTLTMNYSYDGTNYNTALSTTLADPSSSYNKLMLGGITYSSVGSYTTYRDLDITSSGSSPNTVPEPGGLAPVLLGAGALAGMGRLRRWRGSRH